MGGERDRTERRAFLPLKQYLSSLQPLPLAGKSQHASSVRVSEVSKGEESIKNSQNSQGNKSVWVERKAARKAVSFFSTTTVARPLAWVSQQGEHQEQPGPPGHPEARTDFEPGESVLTLSDFRRARAWW